MTLANCVKTDTVVFCAEGRADFSHTQEQNNEKDSDCDVYRHSDSDYAVNCGAIGKVYDESRAKCSASCEVDLSDVCIDKAD